jgi:hypothetical protein
VGARRGSVLKPALVLFGLILGFYVALAGFKPPPALPETAPPAEFSAGRALKYVERLSAKPHPFASAAHDEVLEEVVGLWRSLGFEPEVQDALIGDAKRGEAAKVANVLARLKGTEGGKAVMLVAHYDSVPASFGAADDASGTAVLLETARALKIGPAPKHDIIFLVTDAEETGLIGARAFVGEHPWAADVGLAVNFEARGTSGPSIMFETSDGNGPLIRAFAASAPRPQATSFAVTIYRRMPNGTDLSVFLDAGMQGLNFAFIGEPRDYHTPQDSLAHLDPRSLQHHGSSALALARHFGEAGVPEEEGANAVYFNAVGSRLIVYSSRTAALAALLAFLLLAAAGVVGFRKGLLAPRKLAWSGLFVFLVLVLGPVLAVLFAKLVGFAHGSWLPMGEPASNAFYFAASLFLVSAVFLVLYGLFRRRNGWSNMAFASGSLGVLLTIWLCAAAPGASYITGWSSLLGAAAILGIFLAGKNGIGTAGGAVAVALCSFAAAVIFVPLTHFIFVALGLTPMGAAGIAVFMFLALSSLVPAIEVLSRNGTGAWVLFAFLAFAGAAIAGAATTRYTVRHPRPSQMGYCLDLDAGKADWFIAPGAGDSWTAEFMPAPNPGFRTGDPSLERVPFVGQPAPTFAPEPPHAEKIEDTETPDGRTVRLRVRSPRPAVELAVEADKADVAGIEWNGTPVAARGPGGNGLRFRFYGPGPDGYELTLRLRSREAVPVTVFEWTLGLPEIPGRIWPEPPPEIMPVRLWTMIRKTWVL